MALVKRTLLQVPFVILPGTTQTSYPPTGASIKPVNIGSNLILPQRLQRVDRRRSSRWDVTRQQCQPRQQQRRSD